MRESICSPPTVPAVDTKTQATPRKDWRQHPRIDAHRGKKTKKHGFQCRANVDGFLHLYLKNFFFSLFFLFYLLKLSTDHIIDREHFFQRIRKNRTQKIFENNNFLVFGVIVEKFMFHK